MKFTHTFSVNHEIEKCWNFFQNIELLVQCIPGAALKEDCGNGKYIGDISISLGPFKAKFEGEATHKPDNENYSGILNGKALDKKGGSRTKISLSYLLNSEQKVTNVKMDADIQLSGPIAQFGRIGVIQETAKLLINQFVENAEEQMTLINDESKIDEIIDSSSDIKNSSKPLPEKKILKNNNSISFFNILGLLFKNYFLKMFKK